jgi:hypothetical protein
MIFLQNKLVDTFQVSFSIKTFLQNCEHSSLLQKPYLDLPVQELFYPTAPKNLLFYLQSCSNKGNEKNLILAFIIFTGNSAYYCCFTENFTDSASSFSGTFSG